MICQKWYLYKACSVTELHITEGADYSRYVIRGLGLFFSAILRTRQYNAENHTLMRVSEYRHTDI